MNLITVIPLSRAKVAQNLSYFTASDVQVGSVVSVPIRSKNIHAIVTDVKPAETAKSEIKKASFEIRKLNKIKATQFFSKTFMESCMTLSDFYTTNIGPVVYSLVSETLMDNVGKIQMPPQTYNTAPINSSETYAVQGDDGDRISTWRSLTRQEFAKKNSVAVYLPTIEDALNIYDALEKGIEGYIFLLHNELTKKKIVDTWNKISKTEHPVVVIATPSFSILPRQDIQSIIIERENARGWISQRTPYMDTRHCLEFIARKEKKNVYLADNMLRTETLNRLDEAEIAQGSPFKWRSISDAKDSLIDMLYEKNKITEKEIPTENNRAPFRVISKELEKLIIKNKEENLHLFIMATRRGMAPITICDDCETIVGCRNCSAPMVLHTSRENNKNFFMCHKCGERRSAEETCIKCNSWRLTPLGIGVDRVYSEIHEKFPDHDIVEVNSDSTKTEKQIILAIEYWKSHPGSILIGTEMTMLYIKEKVDHIAVVSLDSLFSLPDFRIEEKIMYTLIRLRSMASRIFMVQTRKPDEKVFDYGLKGNLSDFYRTTIASRKIFNYPPFKILVKITIEGKKDEIAEMMGEIQKDIGEGESGGYDLEIFPAFTATVRGQSIIHGLLRIDPMKWPDMKLINILRNLPPNISVKVNPESLL